MRKKTAIAALSLLMLIMVFAPLAADAQTRPKIRNVDELVNKVLCPVFKWMFVFFIVISIIMIIWSAYLFLFSGGETEHVSDARRALLYTVIAIAVAILARNIPLIVSNFFGSGGSAAC